MKYLSTLLFLCFYSFSFSQIFGLWEVTQVKVGEESITPIAKWFQLHPDQTYQTGNGGLQNDSGTFTMKDEQLLLTNKEGVVDELGPFSYQFKDGQLSLNRKEMGMDIIVHLTKVTKKPEAPWDLIVGNWNLEKILKNDQEVKMDSEVSYQIRWDRLFFKRENGQESNGIWFIHGHRSEVRLIPNNRTKEDEFWDISFPKAKQMVWQSKDGTQKLYFSK